MRRFLFGVVIASVAAAMPAWAFAGDREIAKAVMAELQQHKAAGNLKGFDLDMQVEDGVVYLNGRVASSAQRSLVAKAASDADGVNKLVNNIKVVPTRAVTTKAVPTKAGPTKAVSTKAVSTKAVPTKAVPTKAVPTKAVTTKAVTTKAVPTKAGPTKAVSTKAVSTKAVSTKAVSTKAVSTKAVSTKAVPTKAVPTKAIPTKVVSTKVAPTKVAGTSVPTKAAMPRPVPAAKASARKSAQPLKTTNSPVRTAAAVKPKMTDGTITDVVISRLQSFKNSGKLKGFQLDVSTERGQLVIDGRVANKTQKNLVIEAARRVRGVVRVVDKIQVGSPQVRTVSTGTGITNTKPVPAPAASSMPVAAKPMPRPVNAQMASAPMTPVPMNAATYGGGAPRYDQPNMPGYAWPSYAAHPNYAAVTYPKQYSPSAWPYIGPFYPYPQVPLGWRKVALEWDDGLWYLDFTSK